MNSLIYPYKQRSSPQWIGLSRERNWFGFIGGGSSAGNDRNNSLLLLGRFASTEKHMSYRILPKYDVKPFAKPHAIKLVTKKHTIARINALPAQAKQDKGILSISISARETVDIHAGLSTVP